MNHYSREPDPTPDVATVDKGLRVDEVLDHSPVVMYTTLLNGDQLVPQWVSRNVLKILGYTTEQVLTPGWWWSNVHPDDRAPASLTGVVLLDRGQRSHEYRFRHANGNYIWILDQLNLVDRPGITRTVVGSWTDVTDARRHRERLEEAEAHYRRLISTSPYAVYTLDEEGRFREMNPAAQRLLGRGDLLGESFATVMSPDDLPAANELFDGVMSGGDEPRHAELRVRRPDGSDRLLAISVSPITRDGVPGVHGVHGIARDITDERRAEIERERARHHYERLVKTSPDAIYALDLEGRFTEVSLAATHLLRRPAEELIGTSFAALIAPEDLPIAAASLNRKLADEVETTEINIHMIRGDGERRLVNIRATQIREDGRVVGSHGIGRDITEESARLEQLRRAERLASIGTMVAGVAHELNNPLTAIAGFAELMLMDPHSPDDTEMLRLTMREATRAAKIVSDLRLIASDTQVAPTPREAVDLNDVVRHALTLQRYTLETSNVQIIERLADDLPLVHGTVTELEQVVLNLLVNARHALEQQPAADRRVIITTLRTAECVLLRISDNGPGIEPEVAGRIFDPFYTTKGPGEGMGLGLSLVHRIVTEHHGRIAVESAPGAGATFNVELPHARRSPSGPTATEPRRAPSLRILVVDDEEPIRRALLRFLRRRGHVAEVASDGAEALQLIHDGEYDVVLTDLRMPGMGGDLLLDTLRARDPESARRVMLMTGHVVPGDNSVAAAYADVPLIRKPFSLDEIGAHIEEHAARLGRRAGGTG